MSKIVRSVIEELKNIILYCNAPNFFDNDDEFYELIKEKTNNNLLYGYIHSFSNLMNEMKNNNNNKILLEIEIIKISESATHSNSVELPKIENQMKTNPQTIVKEKEETTYEEKVEQKKCYLVIKADKLDDYNDLYDILSGYPGDVFVYLIKEGKKYKLNYNIRNCKGKILEKSSFFQKDMLLLKISVRRIGV